MVVPVTESIVRYVWNNVTTEFSYPHILDGTDLFVSLYNDNGVKVLDISSSQYTLSATFSSGILTITDAEVLATLADKIILNRIETLDQDLDLEKFGDFPPEEIERTFDKSRLIDQQQETDKNRSVQTNIVESRTEPIELPVSVDGLVLGWNSVGDLQNIAITSGTALPSVPDTYIKRNSVNSAFVTKTTSEVKTDLGVDTLETQVGTNTTNIGTNSTDIETLQEQLPIGYINDTITYLTATTIEWSGNARSSDNTTNLSVVTPITATLTGTPLNATRHIFIGLNVSDVLVAEFTDDVTGATGLATIVGAKRRVLSIITDGSGDIIPFVTLVEKSGAVRTLYDIFIRDYNSSIGANVSTDVPLSIPTGLIITPIISFRVNRTSTGTADLYTNNKGKSLQIFVASVDATGTWGSSTISSLFTNDTIVNIQTLNNALTALRVETNGYIDERND